MEQLIRHIGDNGIYLTNGDKVGVMYDSGLLDDMVAKLEETSDGVSDEERELLSLMADNKITAASHLTNLIENSEKHKANEQHFDNLYEIVSAMSCLSGWSTEEVTYLNDMIHTLEQIDVKQNTGTKKQKKPIIEKIGESRIDKRAEETKQKVRDAIQRTIGSLHQLASEV